MSKSDEFNVLAHQAASLLIEGRENHPQMATFFDRMDELLRQMVTTVRLLPCVGKGGVVEDGV